MNVELADEADARRLAELHAARITEGFLPTLGLPFLTRLYRRIVRSPDAFATVVRDGGRVVGFTAAAEDLGALYRRFAVRDGPVAGVLAAPRILRSWRRVAETLRYPAAETELPDAEILSVAVDAAAARRGIGRAVLDAATAELARRGVPAVRVVVGADNAAAIALYERSGFERRATLEVHAGTRSEVLVWTAS